MATVKELPGRRNLYAVIPNPLPGRRPIFRSTKTRNRKNAQIIADRIEREIFSQRPPFTVLDALEEAHQAQLLDQRSPETIDRSRIAGAQLIGVLGERFDLANCNAVKTGKLYLTARRAMGVSDHTVEKEVAHLIYGMHCARISGDYHGDNPSDFRPKALAGCYVPRERAPSQQEFEAVLRAHDGAFESSPKQVNRRDHLMGYRWLGVRQSELFKIPKRKVDLHRSRLFVEGTKTRAARRWVPIFTPLRPTIERLMDEPGDMLFTVPWCRQNMRQRLTVWCKSAEVEMFTANDIRRAYATALADAGVEESLCMKWMGHTSSKMIRAVYKQVTDRQTNRAIERVDALVDLWSPSAPIVAFPAQNTGTGND